MYSRQLAKFASQLRYEDFSQENIEACKMIVADIIAVAIGGSEKEASKIWYDSMLSLDDRQEVRLWQKGFPKTSLLNAACINAAYGHVLDFDDLHNSSIVHLAVITVPAGLALAEKLGKSGKDLIRAIIAGYDVGARIGEAINPSSYWFWHTTSVAGNFSAAATAGQLLGLDPDQMLHCFGSAGSQAAGLWEFMYDGAMSKTLHVGKANMNGIIAAQLASRGFTGASRILEGEKGLVKAMGPEYRLEALIEDFGQPFKIMTNSIKAYACCRHTHSANYAIQQLIKEKGLTAENVESIVDRTYSSAIELTDNDDPKTLYGHKFSLQYCIAAALVFGHVYDEAFSDQSTQNQLVRETMKKVKVQMDPVIDQEYKASKLEKWIHELDVKLKDGQEFTWRVEYPLGDFMNPFDWQMMDEKFKKVTTGFLTQEEQDKLLDRIHNLEDIEDLSQLLAL